MPITVPSPSRSVAGQAATETMLTMSFLMLLIFATVQLTWWSNFKYGANLGAFAAMRTGMVGGMPNEQLIAARQVVNARPRRAGGRPATAADLPHLEPMTRTVRGSGGSPANALLNGITNFLPSLNNLFNAIPGLLQPQSTGNGGGGSTGSGGSAGGGGSSSSGFLGGLGNIGGIAGQALPAGFGNVLSQITGLVGNLLGSGAAPSVRTRRGLAYIVKASGGSPIQDGVRLVGWSHVTTQPPIAESGDNGGGFFGGFAGFSWPSVQPPLNLPPDVRQSLQNLLNQPGGLR